MAFTKGVNDTLDFAVDWYLWLGTDTIDTSAWTVPAGLVKEDEAIVGTRAIVWLSGGQAGQLYEVVNRIVTLQTPVRQVEESLVIQVTLPDFPPSPVVHSPEDLRGFRLSLLEALASGKSYVRYGEREMRYKNNREIMEAIQMVDQELRATGSSGSTTRQYRII